MKRFLCARSLAALFILLLILAIAVFAPMFIPEQAATQMNMRARLLPPSMTHLLGTDNLGRELFYRVILGTRLSIGIAVAAVWISITIGLPIGILSGYFGGRIDNVLMRLVDAFLSFPVLLLALTISAVLGPSLQNTVLAIGIAFAPFLARIVRAEVLRVVGLPYVEAARAAGTTDLPMIVRHVLPNILPALIVQSTISLAFAILAEAGLSFLGLGTQPPQASWGLMIQTSRDYLDVAPWTALVPGFAIGLTVLALNILGDSLRDALDPRTRR